MINGIICVNKETGYTSHDVVAKLRGILDQKKIGHTGTLDPNATGVLPVCLGNATKLVDMLTDTDKEYRATLLLGVTPDTEDIWGKELSRKEVTVSAEEVFRAVMSFAGTYMQVPPMYSAKKVGGQKLYELARDGRVIERKPREVTIKKIEIIMIQLPYVRFSVTCSKGTYIRSLCRDIGERLGVGGCMSELTRTRVGRFTLSDAVKLSDIEKTRDAGRTDSIVIPTDSFFEDLAAYYSTESDEKLIKNGNPFSADYIGDRIRVYRDSVFAGIYQYDGENRLYRPLKMFRNGE